MMTSCGMRKAFRKFSLATVFMAGLMFSYSPEVAYAVPSLQLDILGGFYDTTTETIVASSDPFTLYALLVPDSKAILLDHYFISAAIVPLGGAAPPEGDLGSFTFNGSMVNVVSGMTFGTAPIDAYAQAHDAGDLPQHGIFPTYFSQFDFTFNSSNTSSIYNTQDDAGAGPSPGTGMYYAAFSVNTTALDSNYALHFDLYNTKTGKNAVNDTDIQSFAPFSHDAQSQVPIPGTGMLMILGMGILHWLVKAKAVTT